MKRGLVLTFLTASATTAAGFIVPSLHARPSCSCQTAVRMAAATASAELPSQAARQQALYDMVYVERLPEAQQMVSGLFLPGKENPRMHVCKVVSIGQGREGESGTLIENAGLNPGDLVYVKDPWGIGPKDDEFSNKKFSFVRYQSICAVIPDSSDFEAKARAAGDEALAIERGGMKQQ